MNARNRRPVISNPAVAPCCASTAPAGPAAAATAAARHFERNPAVSSRIDNDGCPGTACVRRPLRVLTQSAVLTHEPSGALRVARSCQSSQLTATDAAARRSARGTCRRARREIGHRGRHVRDPREVVHAVRIRDVLGPAEDVDRRRVQRRQHVLADVHPGSRRGRRSARRYYAAPSSSRADPRRPAAPAGRRSSSRSTRPARDRCGRRTGCQMGVLGERPVERVGQVRRLRARPQESAGLCPGTRSRGGAPGPLRMRPLAITR